MQKKIKKFFILFQKFPVIKKIAHSMTVSFRRQMIDDAKRRYCDYFKGVVLDIGGRERGDFRPPLDKVEKWIYADIQKKYNPDVILDVSNMNVIGSESIDVITAFELFEHVEKIDDGLRECFRVLKKDGIFMISVPFLYAVHADPSDYQRWTIYKWEKELRNLGFEIEESEIMGRYFTVLAENIKNFFKAFKIRTIGCIFLPLLFLFIKLDNFKIVKKNNILGNFHGGYFLIARKKHKKEE
jgi:SAM-dependent methyltransferase